MKKKMIDKQEIATENKEDNNMKKRNYKIGIFLFIVVILSGVYLTYYKLYAYKFISTDNAYTAGNQYDVTAQINGSVNYVDFEDTQTLEKGILVATIEDSDYQIAFERAKTDLVQAVRDFYSTDTEVKNTNDNYNSELKNYNTIKHNYDRNLKLYSAGILSEKDMESSENRISNATDKLNQALNNLNKTKLQAKSSDIYTHPIVQNAILNLKNSYLNLQRTKIYTPITGKVAKKSISLGSKVKVGENLLTIVNLNNIWVNANFKETQLKNIQIGNTVKIKSDLNKKEYEGIIVGISGGSGNAFSILPPQNATGNWIKITQRIPVRIAILKKSIEKNGTLPLGTSMEVTVDTSNVSNNIPEISFGKTFDPYSIKDQKINDLIVDIIEKNHI